MPIDALDLIHRLHQHRNWATANLLAAAEKLSDEQLRRSFDIGQGSIWKSLLHLYAGEFVWLEALQGNENPTAPGDLPGLIPGNQQGANPIASLAGLCQQWSDLIHRWDDYLKQLSGDSLDKPVYKISTSSLFGQRVATRRYDIFLHLATHAQYTTAQIVNMFRHVGVKDLPEIMLITLARLESTATDRPRHS